MDRRVVSVLSYRWMGFLRTCYQPEVDRRVAHATCPLCGVSLGFVPGRFQSEPMTGDNKRGPEDAAGA